MAGGAADEPQRGGHRPPRFRWTAAIAGARERGWPLVMGILNVTPDSFSDGGRFLGGQAAVEQGLRLAAEGADIVDVGGESTRPGSRGVSAEEELDRVLPVIEALGQRTAAPLSIDTSKARVMRQAVAAGAAIVNDVYGLRGPGALETAAALQVPVVVMHMQGEPRTMQDEPHYGDVVEEVKAFLLERAAACVDAGIPREAIAIDPGFGFGKRLDHNLSLLKHLRSLVDTDFPVLVGLSRKSMIAAMVERAVEARGHASVALALAAARRGAAVLRVHDVAATVDALRVTARVESSS